MRKHRANWLFQDSQESGGDELHAIQWRVAVTEGCKCHSGDVLMKALHAQHERQLFCSLWHRLLLAGELPTGLEGVQWKVHREPDGEGTELAVWTSHRQTDGALVHLCYPSPGGHEEEVAWWEEETQLADGKRSGLLPALWKPPSLVTLQPLELPSFLAWRCQPDGVPGTIPRQNMARR